MLEQAFMTEPNPASEIIGGRALTRRGKQSI
jgi:hypothetical protein